MIYMTDNVAYSFILSLGFFLVKCLLSCFFAASLIAIETLLLGILQLMKMAFVHFGILIRITVDRSYCNNFYF